MVDYYVLAVALGLHFYVAGGAEGRFSFGRHQRLKLGFNDITFAHKHTDSSHTPILLFRRIITLHCYAHKME